jgi:amidase
VNDLLQATTLEQAHLIRNKAVSPLELTQLYLDRIRRHDAQVGSFFHLAADRAIAEAKSQTEQLTTADPQTLPPFFGIPTGVKDLQSIAGMPVSYGVKILKTRMAEADDGIVTRLRQAGFNFLGKMATSQLGALPYTEPSGFPPTRNPQYPDYTAGGSSGGAGAAIAAGFCSIAIGSDAGGSIRIPAACCGLVGLKTSKGRISNAPGGEYFGGFLVQGLIGRSVADVAALLDAMAGPMPGDAHWLPPESDSFLAGLERSIEPLRIGLLTEIPPTGKADVETIAAVEKVAAQLESLGHLVEPANPQDFDGSGMIEPFRMIWQTQMDVGIPGIFLDKMNRSLWFKAQFTKASHYVAAQQALQILARKIIYASQTYDVLLTPTVMFEPPQIGAWEKLSTKTMFQNIVDWIAPCPLFNISGQPAISLPLGVRSNGLPIGVQLVGPLAGDALLLRLARQLEQVMAFSPLSFPG